ncbi:MAG: hypothetical protein GX241_03265 [Ruminococcaceae bacterium]|nr:hypothetical protein [Oscillospiraceae bacterium]
MSNYTKQIENKIKDFNSGKVFIANDFLKISSYETVRRILNRLVDNGKIKRIIKGFYYSPKYSELLQEYATPSMHELAIAIARKYNWDIAPSGVTALNILGLSTQVPAKYTYVSSGRSKEFSVGNITIVFKKVKPGDVANMSFKTATIIQAIKALGKEGVTNKHIRQIQRTLNENEKSNLMNEAISAAAWIYEIIRKVCEENNE